MIITADDFGFTNDTNTAIINLIKDGLITQTSLMVNQPGTKNAIELIHKYNLTNIGLHFNMTQGKSLSDPTITFSKTKSYNKEFIKQELEAQIDFFKQHNISLHHLDSHHHIHGKNQYIYNLMKKYNVRIRTSNTEGFDCDGNEINFIAKLVQGYDELATHVATSTKDLYDTVFLENRVKEYEFFYDNADIIRMILNGN